LHKFYVQAWLDEPKSLKKVFSLFQGSTLVLSLFFFFQTKNVAFALWKLEIENINNNKNCKATVTYTLHNEISQTHTVSVPIILVFVNSSRTHILVTDFWSFCNSFWPNQQQSKICERKSEFRIWFITLSQKMSQIVKQWQILVTYWINQTFVWKLLMRFTRLIYIHSQTTSKN
jgi:hypothetical protein